MKENLNVSFFDAEDVVDDVSVDFNIVEHLPEQLQLHTTITALTILCIVAHALNILNIYSSSRNSVRDFVPDRGRRKE